MTQDSAAHAAFREGGLASHFQSMSEPEAADLAAVNYGLRCSATRFATEKDDTFRLDAEDGRRFVLKVGNPSEDGPEIDLQVRLLEHLARVAPDLPVPRVLPDRDGHRSRWLTDCAGQLRQVRLLSYVAGTPLDSTCASPAERGKVGEMQARLRLAMAGFAHPAQSRVLPWDVQHLLRLQPLLDDVDDLQRRRRLAAALQRFADVVPRLQGARRQVLHNDFSRSNIVVDHAAPGFVTGIIDFGDAVHTAIAVDVSTALLNQLPRGAALPPGEDLFADGRDLLRGYLRVADLTPGELALVPHLVMGRVVARALLTLWRARRFPGNAAYILRNTEPGWGQLDWFLAQSPQDLSAALGHLSA